MERIFFILLAILIFGVMIESNLVEGNQSLSRDIDELVYGKSITDACVGFDDTVKIIETLNNAVLERRKVHQA